MTMDSPTDTEMPEERRSITVLFADLVGSTTVAERLDPDETRLIVSDAIRRVVEAVETYGGHVKDLAGDGVLAFFGAPTAHEDDAERAVLGGLQIASVLEDYARDVERAWGITGFGVRVSLTTGPVVLGALGGGGHVEYAAFGDTVNIAARLQSLAAPGTVLVADSTRRLVETQFTWDEPQDFELRGRRDPVRASVVRGPVASAEQRRGMPQTRLVGRDAELKTLDDAVGQIAGGAGGILLLTGEAGIGKSRLLHELRERFLAAESPIGPPRWLEGRCVSYGESLAYWPFRELLRDWLGVTSEAPELRVRVALHRAVDDLFDERAGEIYPYLGTLLDLDLEPEPAARIAELSPEALQYRTFEVVRTLAQALAARGPLAIAIDDLHWADATSIQLCGALLAAADEAAVLLVVAMRSERDRPAWRLREQVASDFPHRLRELSLESLGADAERLLLESLVGAGTMPPAVERRTLSEAEGNPFFLEEIVRSMTDAGAIVRTDDGWRFDHEVEFLIPNTVEQVILARIARLPADTRRVVTAAAVLGRHFSQPLLEQLVELEGSIREHLTELQRLDLIRENRRWPDPEYRFKHALIQEAAYGTIVAANRRELHRRAGEWLERRREEGGEPAYDLLAHHWLAAEDEDKAIRYLTLAADRARQSWSLDEAVGQYRILLSILERRGERQAMALVLLKMALALHTALRFGEANEAYQRAFEHWSPPVPAARIEATLRVGALALPHQPDPPRSYGLDDIRLQMALLDRLVERWPEATIVPSLAERWEISDDGLTYRFHLREGLRWSDGTPLTASDVEFGVRRNLDPDRPAVSSGIYFVIENGQDYFLRRHEDPDRIGIHALDDRTVEFRLAAPAPYFLSVVNRPDGGPQPRHALERFGDDWLNPAHQVVSGAFEQVERTPERVEIVRRSEPNTPHAGNVRRVVWSRRDGESILPAYAADELDLLDLRGSGIAPSEPTDLILGPPAGLNSISFDFGHPVTGDVAVRRGLAMAIDRDALAAAIPGEGPHRPLTVATGGVVPPPLQGHTPDIALRFDPDQARELITKAGVDAIRVVIPPMPAYVGMRVAADCWEDVLGIAVDRVEPEAADWMEAEEAFDFGPVAPHGWFPGYPDPEYFLRLLLQSDSLDITLRPESRYRSAAFDALIERARQERNGPARLELFHSADRMAVQEDVALVPLYYARNPYLVKPRVSGWWEFGKSWSSFADLEIDGG